MFRNLIFVLILILILFYNGCSFNNFGEANYKKVNMKKEIILLAQQHIKQTKIVGEYNLNKVLIKKKDNYWYVVYLKKAAVKTSMNVNVSLLLIIDSNTKDIIEERIQKGFYIPKIWEKGVNSL